MTSSNELVMLGRARVSSGSPSPQLGVRALLRPGETVEELQADFMRHVTQDQYGCWLWLGRQGNYGTFRNRRAHRVSWELHQGPIPSGWVVLHGCDLVGATGPRRSCVNPAHLRPGTKRQNAVDRYHSAAQREARIARPLAPPAIRLTASLSGDNAVQWAQLAAARGVSAQQLFDMMLEEVGDAWIAKATTVGGPL